MKHPVSYVDDDLATYTCFFEFYDKYKPFIEINIGRLGYLNELEELSSSTGILGYLNEIEGLRRSTNLYFKDRTDYIARRQENAPKLIAYVVQDWLIAFDIITNIMLSVRYFKDCYNAIGVEKFGYSTAWANSFYKHVTAHHMTAMPDTPSKTYCRHIDGYFNVDFNEKYEIFVGIS